MLICLVASSGRANSSEEITPGIIEGLERLLDVHLKQFTQTKTTIQSNFKSINDNIEFKDLKLDPQFMRSLLFYSEDRYLRLIKNDECRFYSSLENNLLKSADGTVETVLINFTNKEGKADSAAIPKNDFFDFIYKQKCLNNREYSILFNEQNFSKTIEGIKFTTPKNAKECETIHSEWIDNPFTPYLCRISQILKKSPSEKQVELYKKNIAAMPRTYIVNLCENLTNPAGFCENYLKNDLWSKVINGEAPTYKMSFKCQNMLGKKFTNASDLSNCASKYINEPQSCETSGNKGLLSLFPLQNCNETSEALIHSSLVTNYHDCPGNLDNEAITNVHRIVNHFSPQIFESKKETCAEEAQYSFAKLNFQINHEEGWPLKVCFKNRVSDNETCTPYFPGSRADEPLSEDKVVAKILYTQKGAPPKTKCRLVDSKSYNPVRSEYKFGCFIVFDAESCTALSCKKKVIWEDKELKDISFVGKPIFDYFPTAFMNERYSFYSMVNEVLKTQQRTIKNLTDLKFYLNKMPSSIIHGVGCAEDLLPEDFSRTVINQCHPLPFIIDGFFIKNNETWLVLRSAIDDLHSPRRVQWTNVFNSVSSYKELHPLNSWTLYGIKK